MYSELRVWISKRSAVSGSDKKGIHPLLDFIKIFLKGNKGEKWPVQTFQRGFTLISQEIPLYNHKHDGSNIFYDILIPVRLQLACGRQAIFSLGKVDKAINLRALNPERALIAAFCEH